MANQGAASHDTTLAGSQQHSWIGEQDRQQGPECPTALGDQHQDTQPGERSE